MRYLQRASIQILPKRFQGRAQNNLQRQNLFALRHGRKILEATILAFIASVVVTASYYTATVMFEKGFLNPPQRLTNSYSVGDE